MALPATRFDHGVAGRAAVGLVPVPDRPEFRLNLQRPSFDPGNPQSWNLPAPARRTFGLAVFHNRLFYAVAEGPQVWSVALTPDGGFAANATWELRVPARPRPAEIASILFDADGQIYLAERGAPTGAYDFKALAESGDNRVLRFRPSARRSASPGLWQPVADEYAIGFPPDFRNGNGGIAIGNGYDASGNINRAACGGTLWSTGEQLRNARAPAIAQRLQPGAPLIVDGLQGNAIGLVRPQNEPPLQSYYIDYDDRFADGGAQGTSRRRRHLADVPGGRGGATVPRCPAPEATARDATARDATAPAPSVPPAATGDCRAGDIQMCCRAGFSGGNNVAVTCSSAPAGTNVCPGNSTPVCCTPKADGTCVRSAHATARRRRTPAERLFGRLGLLSGQVDQFGWKLLSANRLFRRRLPQRTAGDRRLHGQLDLLSGQLDQFGRDML